MSFDISPTSRISTYYTQGVKNFRHFTHKKPEFFESDLSTFYTRSFDILHTLFRHFTHALTQKSSVFIYKSNI